MRVELAERTRDPRNQGEHDRLVEEHERLGKEREEAIANGDLTHAGELAHRRTKLLTKISRLIIMLLVTGGIGYVAFGTLEAAPVGDN